MKVLVGVDGSQHSQDAIRALDRLSPDTEVLLVHALDPARLAFPSFGFDPPVRGGSAIELEMRREGERLLDRMATLVPAGMAKVVRKRLAVGPPGEVILSLAREEGAGLVLVGARGLGPIRELVFGSVSNRVIFQAPCPVLVIRGPVGPIQRVLLAVETEKDADALLGVLAQRTFPGPVEIEVVSVVPLLDPLNPLAPLDEQAWMRAAAESADKTTRLVADRARALGYVARRAVRFGAPAEAILNVAEERSVDVILMGSHGGNALCRFFLGSVAHAVLHRADVPVLVVRHVRSAEIDQARRARLVEAEEVAQR